MLTMHPVTFLDAIASPSTYPCQWVSGSVSGSLIVSDLEIAIASPSFASLFEIHEDGILIRNYREFKYV